MSFPIRVRGWLCVLALVVSAGTIFSGVAQTQKKPQTHTVVIHNFAFRPADLAVNVGDTVLWKNMDIVSHMVTAADGSFDSDEIKPGNSWKLVANKAGTFAYSCSPHPNMHGKLTAK